MEEVGGGERYRCKRCTREWRYEDSPYWWRCPTDGCADWLGTAGPGVSSITRALVGKRPRNAPPLPPPARNAGGRPRNPAVPAAVQSEAFVRLSREYGHYPPDKDLADDLGVSEATIRNYRKRGTLPPRPDERV